jgi:hypothetical protein
LAISLLAFILFVPFFANHTGNVDNYSGATGLVVDGVNHNMMPPPKNQHVQGLLSPAAGLQGIFLGKATT